MILSLIMLSFFSKIFFSIFCFDPLLCQLDFYLISKVFYYLAPNFVWERGIVLLVWVCDSVALWLCGQDYSKSSWPISIKFGRMLSYNINKVWLEFDVGRTRTLSNRNFKSKSNWQISLNFYQDALLS